MTYCHQLTLLWCQEVYMGSTKCRKPRMQIKSVHGGGSTAVSEYIKAINCCPAERGEEWARRLHEGRATAYNYACQLKVLKEHSWQRCLQEHELPLNDGGGVK
ncbi:hypothetical protein CHS0354_022979, partial [Potamilus streckersoni]